MKDIAESKPVEIEDRSEWLPSILISAFQFATSVANFFLAIFFSDTLHFTGSQIGILYAVQALTGVLSAFPAGLSNDRITSRTLVGISLVMQGIAYILMSRVRAFPPFVLIFFTLTLFFNIFRVSLDVQLLKTDTGQKTSRRIAFFQSWRFAGLTFGTIIAGYILVFLDFPKSLLIVGIICLFLSLTSFRLAPTPVSKVRLSDYKADFTKPRIILFAAWMFLFSTHWGAEYTCYGLFLRKILNLSYPQMGWYMAAEFTAVFIALMLVRKRMDGKNRLRTAAIVGLVTSGLGHIGMIYPDMTISMIFRSIHGFGDGLMTLVLYIGIARLFAVEHLGGNAGLMNLTVMLGFIVGSLFYSPLGEKFGYQHPFWMSGLLTFILAAPILTPHPEQWFTKFRERSLKRTSL